MPKLNPKEEKFCIAYASNANAKQSVIDAGYSMKENEENYEIMHCVIKNN